MATPKSRNTERFFLLLVLVAFAAATLACQPPPKRKGIDKNKYPAKTISATPNDAMWDDADEDGLTTTQEEICGTQTGTKDSDSNGLDDYAECTKDSDGDGVKDSQEKFCGTDPGKDNSNPDGISDKAFCDPLIAANTQVVDPYFAATPDSSLGNQGSSTLPPGTAGDTVDTDGDTLTASQEAACGTSDNNPDTDGDGTPDSVDCAGGENAGTAQPQTPRNLVRRYTFAIGKETKGSSALGRDIGAYQDDMACADGEVLTGIDSCYNHYIERIDSIECAKLGPDGVLKGHRKITTSLGGKTVGAECGGTGILEQIAENVQGPTSAKFTCNRGGNSNEYITGFDGKTEAKSNITSLKMACGELNKDIVNTPGQMFKGERTGVEFGGQGIGNICKKITAGVGEPALSQQHCPEGYVAVGLHSAWDDKASFEPAAAAAIGAGAGGAVLAGCAIASVLTAGIGGILCVGGATLAALGGACFLQERLPTVHSFQLLCKRVTIFTEVVDADEQNLQCVNDVGVSVPYDAQCHGSGNILGAIPQQSSLTFTGN